MKLSAYLAATAIAALGGVGCTLQTGFIDDSGLVLADSGDFFQENSVAPAGQSSSKVGFQIQGYEAQSEAAVTHQFEALGFDNVDLYSLQPTYPVDSQTFALKLPEMMFMAFREGGWNRGSLLDTVGDLPARFAACGIGLSDILVVETSLPPGRSTVAGGLNFDTLSVDDYNKLSPLIQRLPVRRRPLFFFVGSIHSNRLNQSVGGFAADVFSDFSDPSVPNLGDQSPIAVTGAVARRPIGSNRDYQFDQTISHEIAHLLGLQHQHEHNQANIMTPVTCKDCSFTANQCAQMRESPLLVRGNR